VSNFPEGNAIVYCEGAFNTTNGKTAHGLVRMTKRYKVLSVIDSRYEGEDAGEVLDGRTSNIPIFSDLSIAIEAAKNIAAPASHLVVGLAPDGGRLSERARRDIAVAIQQGLHVDSGLHDLLSEDSEITKLAAKYNVSIRDIRKVPPRDKMHFFCGKISEVKSLKIAVLGTDSAIGKRTTAWLIHEAFRNAGLSVELIGTGQTAWMQGARYSIIIDSLIVDFVTGEIEHAIWQAWNDSNPDVILIEGQGSLLNPAYPGGMEILSAGRPDVIVLQHAPGRKEYDGFPGYALHPLEMQIRALEIVSGTKVGAITINNENILHDEITDVCRSVSKKIGLPTVDVLHFGADEIVRHLVRVKTSVNRVYRQNRNQAQTWGNDVRYLAHIDQLDVGPVRLEKDRLVVPYSVLKNGTVDSINLLYRFGEEVFDPDDSESQNIASIIAAQVAINYGLFCKRIVFHGSFDETDRYFIQYMLRNTAREIYVKRFLEDNPFLVKGFPSLRVEINANYINAALIFPDHIPDILKADRSFNKKYCVLLLSGGKESLLSYGLLKEIGMQTFPVFINESGRHWYTALNSYRSFRHEEPGTSKVWTNADRVFTFMLEHLPFIRHDFTQIRSDEYPLRLWTVAVFLFGALPILLKRGAGMLVIGDEYDTTRRMHCKGIPHFDGLYDQSRFFDQSMTLYFKSKGWVVNQFSILRSLSELLVQKILVKRYPELQINQISCHAAHIENEHAFPCGRCEKCHRIVSMLVAIGADPTICGYTNKQVREILQKLSAMSMHQESLLSDHVLFLLIEKGLIDKSKMARYHSEVESLRFNNEQAPYEAIPEYIRNSLLSIFLQYASGSIKFFNGNWISFDPFVNG
jgi:uncharacterized NAD-dependent epimerase/dehydratase family protein